MIKLSNASKKFLRKQEWSLGWGQCPHCYGEKPGPSAGPFRGGFEFDPENRDQLGHKKNCKMAKMFKELNLRVRYAAERVR
jgi:hypothetical protein